MNAKQLPKLVLAVLLVASFVSATQILIESARAATFNQNNLIDDSLFIDHDSMTVSEIQDWLEINGGGLLENWVDNVDMRRPSDNCIVHHATGMTAAEIIHEAATAWNAQVYDSNGCAIENAYWGDPGYSNYTLETVSPKALLVTLQKEQSLISASGGYSTDYTDYQDPNCCSSNEYKLARAMGYGVPDSGSINEKYLGFYNQINWAAWQLRFNFERSAGNTAWDNVGYITYSGPMIEGTWRRCASCALESFDGFYPIDGSPLYMENRATASLYYYTPHTYPGFFGNYNFVNFYIQWFGAITTDIVRVVSDSGDPTQFIIYDGKKQGIPSNDVLFAWGLHKLPLDVYPDATLTGLPSHTGNLKREVRFGGNYYLIDSEVRYLAEPISDALYDVSSTTTEVGTKLFEIVADGGGLSPFVTPASSSTVAMVTSPTDVTPFGNVNTLKSFLGASKVIPISDSLYASFTEGTAFSHNRISHNSVSFIISEGRRLRIGSGLLDNYPNQGSEYVVSDDVFAYFINGGNTSRFVKNKRNGAVYLVNDEKTQGIPNPATLILYTNSGSSFTITQLSNEAFDLIPTGSTIRSNIIQEKGTTNYYVLSSDGLRTIQSDLEDNYDVASTALMLDDYHVGKISPSATDATPFVTSNESPAVFMLSAGSRYGISNPTTLTQLLAPGEQITTINNSELLGFPKITNTANYFSNSGTNYVVVEGTKHPVSVDVAADYGLTGSELNALPNGTIDHFPTGATLTNTFSDGGVNYLVTNGASYSYDGTHRTLWGLPASPASIDSSVVFRAPNSGALTRFTAKGGTIYTVDQGELIGLSSLNKLFNLGYTNQSISSLSQAFFDTMTVSATGFNGVTVRDSSNNCYVLDAGSLRTPNGASSADWCPSPAALLELSDTYRAMLPAGAELTTSFRVFGDTTIYAIDNETKRWIPSNTIYTTYFAPLTGVNRYIRDILPSGPTVNSDGS